MALGDIPTTLAIEAAPVERLLFERYEYKYWVPKAVAMSAVRFAAPYLAPDVYGDAAGGACQRNTSLYLDSPRLDFYNAHLESEPDRLKLRIRRYGSPVRGSAFFEIKRKVKSVIVKKRAKVPAELVAEILAGHAQMPLLPSQSDHEHLEAFLYLQTIYRAEPLVLITCIREAYMARDRYEDVRFTVDSEIAYQPARGASFDLPEQSWTRIDGTRQHGDDGGRVLIEMKFSGTAPLWMQELVERLGMWRGAYSKYVSAVAFETGDRYHADDFGLISTTGV
jgi:VTC domain